MEAETMEQLEVTWWRATRIWWSLAWRSIFYTLLFTFLLGTYPALRRSHRIHYRYPHRHLGGENRDGKTLQRFPDRTVAFTGIHAGRQIHR